MKKEDNKGWYTNLQMTEMYDSKTDKLIGSYNFETEQFDWV